MKLKFPLVIFFCSLSLSLSAFAEDILFEETFDQPNGISYQYPPAEGQKYEKFHKTLTAWANNDGQINITNAEGAGEDKTGGLICKVAQKPTSGGYLGFNCEGIKIPIGSAEEIEKVLNALELNFSIKVPTGKTVDVFIQASSRMFPADPALKDAFRLRAYPDRGVFPKVNGNDDFTKYTYKCADMTPGSLDLLTEYLTELVKNGALDLDLAIAWNISGPLWTEESEFSIDNLKVTLNR